MAEGGFLVKFDGKEVTRCYAIAFDYDEWQYTINETQKKELPAGIETITIAVEQQ
jgi:hypothetical protein